eukprot:gnl/MRDRNA2_/MRDRNA2_79103_c0_seq1.p1 gnl/MRDRNA2_/MRDRNA2_79103_c0~~gnl/MRDRNA2_/MRDRNA2_79103_c0_seq1.p1  ORF type:complete len:129 (+),score=5.18 gnl/MRDRNA2_/MRDRNA2_79103_c0_seq1:98-484(+)
MPRGCTSQVLVCALGCSSRCSASSFVQFRAAALLGQNFCGYCVGWPGRFLLLVAWPPAFVLACSESFGHAVLRWIVPKRRLAPRSEMHTPVPTSWRDALRHALVTLRVKASRHIREHVSLHLPCVFSA